MPETAERAYQQQCDLFAAWVYPLAPEARLEALSCLDLMMFLDDDHADEGAVRRRPLTDSSLLEVVEEPMSSDWRARFRSHLSDWEGANARAARRRARSAPPQHLEEYLPWRRVSSTLFWHFDLVEYAQESELPAEFVSGSRYRALADCAADVIAWTNDLFSAPKELSRGEQDNLVAVLTHHQSMDLQEAVALTAEWIADRTRQFLSARDSLAAEIRTDPSAADTLLEWTDGLGRWAGGNLGFCLASARYPHRLAAPEPGSGG
ncbi:terpene synthase family protein [Streptomyces argenteolus]|uniref:Terpene synthase n=1 Tax=Streptomyces argenteolus TaxID=67274 RepID=A0ABW6XEH6_9ACTN